MIGRVLSNKNLHTAVVLASIVKTDPLYKKRFMRTKRYSVDDPLGVAVGDVVEFVKVRPISKNKHWRITKKVGRDIEEVVGEQLKEQAEELIEEVMGDEEGEKNGTA